VFLNACFDIVISLPHNTQSSQVEFLYSEFYLYSVEPSWPKVKDARMRGLYWPKCMILNIRQVPGGDIF
jgi:hypothetical protein